MDEGEGEGEGEDLRVAHRGEGARVGALCLHEQHGRAVCELGDVEKLHVPSAAHAVAPAAYLAQKVRLGWPEDKREAQRHLEHRGARAMEVGEVVGRLRLRLRSKA